MTKPTSKKPAKKYDFLLKALDVKTIDKRYNIRHIPNIASDYISPSCATRLTQLSPTAEKEPISFFDTAKKLHKCDVSIIDFNTQEPLQTRTANCFWCRHPFTSPPIGCPVEYISDEVIKTYQSYINKEVYTIKQNITTRKKNKILNNPIISDDVIQVLEKRAYLVDGVFCDKSCLWTFLEDPGIKMNPLYKNSKKMFFSMYYDITGILLTDVEPAPHWRKLIEYGGDKTIEQFRDGFETSTYIYHGTVKTLYRPIGHLYEERLKF